MARVDLNIWARLHQQSLNQSERELVGRFQRMGQEAARTLPNEINRATPKVRKAYNRMADAVSNKTRAVREDTRAQQESNKAAERALRIEADIADQRQRNIALAKAEERIERRIAQAVKRRGGAKGRVTQLSNAQRTAQDKKTARDEQVRLGNSRIKDYRLAGQHAQAKALDKRLQPLRKEQIREDAKISNRSRVIVEAKKELAKQNDEVARSESDLDAVRRDSANGTRELTRAENDHARTLNDVDRLNDRAINTSEARRRANEREEESVRSLADARRADSDRRGRGNHRTSTVGSMMTSIPGVPGGRAGAVIGTGVLTVLASLADVVVTASQSLALLPAIATAAGAGVGTLVMATNGFGQAIKDMGDPKKFAEALQALSPAAQQAALEIKSLVDGPLGALQNKVQETLFTNVARDIHNASQALLPSIDELTSGVAQSFSNIFSNLTSQLSSTSSLDSIGEIVNNIVAAFQKFEPSIQNITRAFLKLTEVGSTFLPGMAGGFSDITEKFANFIDKTSRSGELQNFLQKGIDGMAALGRFVLALGQDIYEVFGNKKPEEFEQIINDVKDAIKGILSFIEGFARGINELLQFIQPMSDAVGGWDNAVKLMIGTWIAFKALNLVATITGISAAFGLMPAAAGAGAAGILAKFGKGGPVLLALGAVFLLLGDMSNRMEDFQARSKQLKDDMASAGNYQERYNARKKAFGPGADIPAPEKGTFLYEQMLADAKAGNIPGLAVDKDGNFVKDDSGPIVAPPGQDWQSQLKVNPSRREGLAPFSLDPGRPTAGLDPFSPHDVPGIPPDSISDSDRRKGIRAGLNPNSFMPDVGNLPAMSPGAPQQGNGTSQVDQNAVDKAAYDVTRQARSVRDARMDLAVLQRDSLSTEEELLLAREKVQDEEVQLKQKQIDLMEAQQGKFKKAADGLTSGMGELSAGLDKDLGISKGLAGMADNLVRFLGNLATAPLQAMFNKIKAANPNEGSGLVGIAAANGVFGPDLTPQGIANGGGQSPTSVSGVANSAVQGTSGMPNPGVASGQSYGLPTGTNTGGYGSSGSIFPPWVHAMEQQFGVKASTYPGHQEGDRNEAGYAANPNHENRGIDWTGSPQAMQALADYMSQLPGAEQVIFRNPATGQDTESVAGQSRPGYFASDLPGHANHVHTRQSQALPLPDGTTAPGATGSGYPGITGNSAPSFGGATPVFVVNMPGQIPGMGGPGGPASGQGAGPLPGPGQRGLSASQWNNIAGAEASGDWKANTGNGFFGGLQFQQSTWDQFGGGKYAPRADMASPEQQMDIGNKVFAGQGSGAWPATSAAHPDWFSPTASAAPTGPMPGPGQGGPGQLSGSPLAGNFPGSQPTYQPTQQPAAPQGWQAKGGGGGGGGLLGMAMSGAAMGADLIAPGSGAAVQMANQAIQRTIKYGGEMASHAVTGVMDTLSISDPDGGAGANLNDSWIGRLGASLASSAPALPSTAAKADQQQQQPGQGQPGQPGQPQQPGGVTIGNITMAPERQNVSTMANDLAYATAAGGLR